MSNALGMIETKGYVAALAAADAMVKAANVTIVVARAGRRRPRRRGDPGRRRSGQGRHRGGLRDRRGSRRAGLGARDPAPARRARQALRARRAESRLAATPAVRAAGLPADRTTCGGSSPRRWARRRAPAATRRCEDEHALIVEVAPGLAIERVTDLALKAVPDVEPGILFVERQFGVLEVHSQDREDVERAGAAILAGIGATAGDQLRPRIAVLRRDRGHHRPARGDRQPHTARPRWCCRARPCWSTR